MVKDWTFGTNRPDATVRNRQDLDREFYYRYIFSEGRGDNIPTYWSHHRDYPDGDPRSLHVFGDGTLTLKGRIPEHGGLRPGGIESGMLRGKLPVTPGMYIEMRAKLPRGVGAWPAFWLSAGVQYANASFSPAPWPPEIDIFEFFNWQRHPDTTVLTTNVHTENLPKKEATTYDIFSVFKDGKYEPGFDFSKDFHVFALDWRKDEPVWLLDGRVIRKTHYEWHAPPAHILVTNQIGIGLPYADMRDMKADERQWDYVIDYIRVWRHGKEG